MKAEASGRPVTTVAKSASATGIWVRSTPAEFFSIELLHIIQGTYLRHTHTTDHYTLAQAHGPATGLFC
jgi:hypothetical protein